MVDNIKFDIHALWCKIKLHSNIFIVLVVRVQQDYVMKLEWVETISILLLHEIYLYAGYMIHMALEYIVHLFFMFVGILF